MSYDEYKDKVSLAFNNSYQVLFNSKFNTEELIIKGVGFFIFHPSELPTDAELDDMIKFFKYQEEYEKCAQLTKYKNGI